MSTVWEAFDALTSDLVNRTVTFKDYITRTETDFARLARIATRRRRPPPWLDVDDVKIQLQALAWHYLFERVGTDGTVGFDPTRFRNPGAYVRIKIKNKIQKELSRARGENQNTRKGPPAPEYLSRTGELPDMSDDSECAEAMIERSRGIDALKKLATTAREFTILKAMAEGLGDDRRVIAFMLKPESREVLGCATELEAHAVINGFVEEWSKSKTKKGRGAPEQRS